jgi:ADP-dependent NAD(P)H-hydrate dehydratase / NAD(P)H-hydrate epimerase
VSGSGGTDSAGGAPAGPGASALARDLGHVATRRAHTVADIRAAEEQVMAALPDGVLMQRAAAGLAAACVELLAQGRGRVYGARVLVLAGSGNNGGDALYAGARLAHRGAQVDALLLSPDQVHAGGLAALRQAGGRVADGIRHDPDLVLDGIVGIGGSPGLRSGAAAVWADLRSLRPRPVVVAVDVPSGVGADDGTLGGACVSADVTVTFGAYKPGLLVGPGAAHAGAVELVDIGLAPYLSGDPVDALTEPGVAEALQRLAPGSADHKYTRGVVGVAAGSAQYTGAGLLAVEGASCGLAGMVRYVGPDEVADLIRVRRPEVVVGRGQVQCWVVGSGGGGDAAQVLEWAREDGVPLVVDADGLQHVTGPLGVPTVLTPHAGELARMLGAERGHVEADPVRFARAAADRYAAVVLLKGNRTVLAEPEPAGGHPGRAGRRTFVNTTGTPWLGTAGAGDVLAGLVGALLAADSRHGTDGAALPVLPAAVAAWLHGAAATLAGQGGPVVAGDVAAALPAVIRDLAR